MRAIELLVFLSMTLGGLPTGTFASSYTPGPAEREARLERHLARDMELNQIPGLSLVIVHAGRLVYGRAFGMKHLAGGHHMDLDTPVELASLSKSMTALAVLSLVREGTVDLDWPVQQYLPNFQTSQPQLSSMITVRHLLEHRSGFTRKADRLIPCCGQAGDQDLGQAVERLRKVRLASPPGAGFRYANSNYILLAAVVEAASGRPFPEFMRDRIFLPFGMTRTTFDLGKAQAWGLAPLHERIWGRVRLSPSPYRGRLGASAVKSTARDMARYVAALLDETNPLGSLLQASELCRGPAGYRFGWHVEPESSGEPCRLAHTGKIWGANTAAVLVPPLEMGVVVLANCGVKRAGDMANAAVAYHLGETPPAPAAMGWSTIPDNWAITLLISAVLILLSAAMLLGRTAGQIYRGQRHFFRGLSPAAIGRSGLLALMSAVLWFEVLITGAWSRPETPSSSQTAFPLFAISVAILLLLVAVLGLAPPTPARERE